jgi:metallo-beta-lactamase family protein
MTLRLHVHGAARSVTGSCFLLETDQARILVDCGMVQGSKTERELNYRPFPFAPDALDAVVLTHAHIDHSGLLPKLVKAGYAGPIYATSATVDLCSLMLVDSGSIQEMEVETLNRRNDRRGRPAVEPIYTAEDARVAMTQFRAVAYRQWQRVARGIRARFWNAGHLLGSSAIEIEVDQGSGPARRLLFSGDIGPDSKLLQRDPEAPQGLDAVICESTYGDRDRPDTTPQARRGALAAEVKAALRSSGALLIPSFAVERTQELLVDLAALTEAGQIPRIPVFIDSPLASKVTGVFEAHASDLEDDRALVEALRSPLLRFTDSVEQSKALSRIRSFHIVIAASGMCEAGRIRHHLRDWLWREDATVLIVGYQARGTLGRVLLDGASRVRLMGEEIAVRARIRSLDLYSGHADAPELVRWVEGRMPISGPVILVHGEEPALEALAERLAAVLPRERILIPSLDEVFELTPTGAVAVETSAPRRLVPEAVGRFDWHNDESRLILDIGQALAGAADDRARRVILRRLRRALAEEA